MFDIFANVGKHLTRKSPIRAVRLPTFYPSAASCIDKTDGVTPIGACMRAQYFRCTYIPESNPSGVYSQWIFAAGNLWENYLTEQFKQMGLWLANSVKFSIPDHYVSGEVDIVIRHPDTGNKWIVENKTFSSGNYHAAKTLCGTIKGTVPQYKDQNLLQAFLYLYPFRGEIEGTHLTYIDRACGGERYQVQFDIKEHVVGNDSFPSVTTKVGDSYQTTVDKRISMNGIFDRYSDLMSHLVQKKVPEPDYSHSYSSHVIESKFQTGDIAKTNYEAYKRNPEKNPIGDWQCEYCNHKDYCKDLLKEGI